MLSQYAYIVAYAISEFFRAFGPLILAGLAGFLFFAFLVLIREAADRRSERAYPDPPEPEHESDHGIPSSDA